MTKSLHVNKSRGRFWSNTTHTERQKWFMLIFIPLVFLLCHPGLGKNVPSECFPHFPPSHLSKQQYALCSELAASLLRVAKTKVLFEEAEEIWKKESKKIDIEVTEVRGRRKKSSLCSCLKWFILMNNCCVYMDVIISSLHLVSMQTAGIF